MTPSSSQNPVPKFRTYGADLNSVRAKKNISIPTTNTVASTHDTESVEENVGVVPPFHSFKKSQEITETTPVAKKVISSEALQTATQKIVNTSGKLASGAVKENLPAVIITDTKHKRFSLRREVVSSLSNWWATKKEASRKSKIPRYTVAEAGRRKGVIQKATAKTGITASSDHQTVVSHIKTTKQIPHVQQPPIQSAPTAVEKIQVWESAETVIPKLAVVIADTPKIKPVESPRDEMPKIGTLQNQSWETDIQTEVNRLTKTAPISNIILSGKEFTKLKQKRAENVAPAVEQQPQKNSIIKPIVPVQPPRTREINLENEEIIAPKNPTIIIPPVLPNKRASSAVEPAEIEKYIPPITSIITPEVITPFTRPKITPTIPATQTKNIPRNVIIPAQITEAPPAPVVPQAPVAPAREERRFAPPRESRKSLLQKLAGTNTIVFAAFGVLIFVVITGLGLRTYLAQPSIDATKITENSNSFVFTDTTEPASPFFISTVGDIRKALDEQVTQTDSLVELSLRSNSGGKITGSLLLTLLETNVVFDFRSAATDVSIGTYRGTPWILFTVTDKNTALGGMLDWENNLYHDLAPIFGTGTELSRNPFSDNIIGATDVRVLKNDAGVEELVYGFTSDNQLLITGNTTAFLNLAGKVK